MMSEYKVKSCATCQKKMDIEEVLTPSAEQCLDCIEFEGTPQSPDNLFNTGEDK